MTSDLHCETIAHYIDSQCAIRPNATAIEDPSNSLTYGDLRKCTDRIAAHLRLHGIATGAIVALHMERSVDLVVALVGILKAGAAYLPVDPETPLERTLDILKASSAAALLSNEDVAVPTPVQIFLMDEIKSAVHGAEFNHPEVGPDDLISVFFTSGSTGKPKGVMSSQSGWLNRMQWMQEKFDLKPQDRVLHKTTIAFDDSAVELLWPLMVGGCVAVLPPSLHRDPKAIIEAAILHNSRVLHFVPSMLSLFLDALTRDDAKKLSCLDIVISSGEALHLELVEKFYRLLPNSVLYNQWGATEASIDSTCHRCDLELIRKIGKVPLGEPVSKTRIYLLNPEKVPVEEGEIGELYIAGSGVGLGYLGDQDKTSQVFTDDPFCPGEKMYRTGDLGNCVEGHIVFAGRNDSQIKIRGNRVELFEIESVLLEHRAVASCSVSTVTVNSELRIVAFVVLCEETGVEELLAHLRKRLPLYMLPARIIPVHQFPYTKTGKIDRQALKVLSERPDLTNKYRKPKAGTETLLARIFEQVLGISGIGTEDKFTFLGGNSLDATRISSRIEKEFGFRVPVSTILTAGTVKHLASKLESVATAKADAPIAPPWPARLISEHRNMSNAEQRLAFLHHLDGGHRIGALLAYEISGDLQPESLQKAYEILARGHAALRTSFVYQSGKLTTRVNTETEIDYTVVDISNETEAAKEKMIEEFCYRPYDLSKVPLWRVFLLKMAPDNWLLLFSIHPIITDGWSNAILTEEISKIYQALVEDAYAPVLEPETANYAEYCHWIEENIDAPYFERQREYWSKKLPLSSPPLTLPNISAKSSQVDIGESDIVIFDLTPIRLARIKKYSRNKSTTIYTFLLSTLKALIYRLTGQSQICVCTPMAGRLHPKLDNVVGPVVNPVVLYTDFSESLNYDEFLELLNETVAEAYENQSFPFDLVVEDRRKRDLESLLYSIVFVVQNFEVDLTLHNTEITPIFLDNPKHKRGPLIDVASDILLHIEAFERDDTIKLRFRFRQSDLNLEDINAYVQAWFAIIDEITMNEDVGWFEIDEILKKNGLVIRKVGEIFLPSEVLDDLFQGGNS